MARRGRGRARRQRPIISTGMNKLPIRARLATSVGGAAGRVSRLAGRGDGSVIGGVIGLRLEPDLLSLLAAGRQIVLVTGTNGKTHHHPGSSPPPLAHSARRSRPTRSVRTWRPAWPPR